MYNLLGSNYRDNHIGGKKKEWKVSIKWKKDWITIEKCELLQRVLTHKIGLRP